MHVCMYVYFGIDHRLGDVARVHVGGDQRDERAPQQSVEVARHLAREIAQLTAALAEDTLKAVESLVRRALKGGADGATPLHLRRRQDELRRVATTPGEALDGRGWRVGECVLEQPVERGHHRVLHAAEPLLGEGEGEDEGENEGAGEGEGEGEGER